MNFKSRESAGGRLDYDSFARAATKRPNSAYDFEFTGLPRRWGGSGKVSDMNDDVCKKLDGIARYRYRRLVETASQHLPDMVCMTTPVEKPTLISRSFAGHARYGVCTSQHTLH